MGAAPPAITDASVTLSFGAAGVYYGYCSIADVKYEFVNLASMPSLSNSVIAQEITYAAYEMQDQLNEAYVMPYLGADAGVTTTLREVNAKLAASRVIDRYYRGSESHGAQNAADLRQYAELIIMDVLHGIIQWATPFGDAIPRSQRPTYPRGGGATIMPSPTSDDPYAAAPAFGMGRVRFRRTQTF